MRIGILAVTDQGRRLGDRLAGQLVHGTVLDVKGEGTVRSTLAAHWSRCSGFVCIMAAGIVVRSIAPLLEDKASDPAVVVVDQQGAFAVSLLSGHLGGGNALAREVAACLGGVAVITTASDNLGHTALDLWAQRHNLRISTPAHLTSASAALIRNGTLAVYSDIDLGPLPADLVAVTTPEEAQVIVSHRDYGLGGRLQLLPRNLVLGVGCNRTTGAAEMAAALDELAAAARLQRGSLRNLATIVQKHDERGLLQFAEELGLAIEFFTRDSINTVALDRHSQAALDALGAIGVAEPCALLSSGGTTLLIRKRKWKNVTMAVALAPSRWSAPGRDRPIT